MLYHGSQSNRNNRNRCRNHQRSIAILESPEYRMIPVNGKSYPCCLCHGGKIHTAKDCRQQIRIHQKSGFCQQFPGRKIFSFRAVIFSRSHIIINFDCFPVLIRICYSYIIRIFLFYYTVCSFRYHCSGHDPDCLMWFQYKLCLLSRIHTPGNFQGNRMLKICPADVPASQCKSIHR